jgi:hypothetical protein
MRQDNGERCTAPATHRWGDTVCCCAHFDQLLPVLFELQEAVAERRYLDLRILYENYSRQIAKLTGSPDSFPEEST